MRAANQIVLAILVLSSVACQAHNNERRDSSTQTQQKSQVLQQAVEKVLDKHKMFLVRNDINMTLGGRVRQEGFYFNKPLTFRDDYNDKYGFFRAKYNFDIGTEFGHRTQGKAVAVSGVRVTLFNAWNNFDVYTPVIGEPVAFSPQDFIRKAELEDHHHDGNVTLAYIEDAWVGFDLHRLFDKESVVPVEFKVGYFKHSVGRGVSLGTFVDGGIKYLGWDSPGVAGNNTNSPPGIKLTIGNPDDFAFEAYFSKWRKRSHGPDFTREEVKAKRLDIDDTDTRDLQRGVHADRDLVTARLFYNRSFKNAHLLLEPYAVYVNAPELEVEFEGDASARIATFGMMTELKHGNWTFNAEVAAQFGHQDMHPIDRNHSVIDESYYRESATDYAGTSEADYSVAPGRLDITTGQPTKYHSHVVMGIKNIAGSASEFLPYRAHFISDEIDRVNRCRGVDQNGARIVNDPPEKNETHLDGSEYISTMFDVPYGTDPNRYAGYDYTSGMAYFDNLKDSANLRPDGSLFNANIPFGGGQRFRPAYRLDCQGVMAMADISYTFPSKHLTLGFAAAHISGDDYPLNKQEDQTYKGFIPFKDQDYTGYSVQSYAMLAARKIGRPTTFSDSLMHAPVNYETMTNLQYIGTGCVWRPYENRSLLMVEGNALYFWQDCPPFTWDKHATRSFGSDKIDGIYSKAQSDLNFTGHQTTTRASNQLGFELNAVVAWRPIPNCELRLMLATFVPGKLYSDVQGTPSAYTIRRDKDGDLHFDSMGTQVPFGGMFRLTYWF